MMQARPDHDFLGALQNVPDSERDTTITAIEAKGDSASALDKVMLEALLAIKNATPEDSQGEPDQAELSLERERTLGLLLARYDENLGKGLYTAESAPKAEVEKWLRQDPTRLDKAARWEARGGKPMFTGEESGEFCIDECSAEVPKDIRNICYGPKAAEQQGLGRDRNVLTQVEGLGGTLMTRTRREKLFAAGLIQDSDSWEWLLDPENRDLVMEGDKVKDYGLAWGAGDGGVGPYAAGRHAGSGGQRCSLRGQRP